MTNLRELAKAATPGPWKTHLVDDTTVIGPDGVDVCTTCDSSQAEREDGYNVEYERMEADAAFIAAANPAAISALYAELDEARCSALRAENTLKLHAGDCMSLQKEINDLQLHHEADMEAAEASLSEKEREVERLKIALADAIRRPMGVIPASAEGLITYTDVAAAEERRATLTQEPTNAD